MKRFLPSVVAISSVLALAATAGAGDHHNQGQHDNHRKEQRNHGFGTWGGVPDGFKKHHGHKHNPTNNPIPIDPGKGDGRPPVDPAPPTRPVPAPRDGFVWVNGHWEREKAPRKVVNPYPADVTVRDHRTTTGGVTVRDHRTTTGGVTVREHRTTTGGVTVRDHRTTTDTFPAGTTVRDHRTSTGNASGGVTVTANAPTIRDHRTTPVVRDHRTTPVVRDHRTPSR